MLRVAARAALVALGTFGAPSGAAPPRAPEPELRAAMDCRPDPATGRLVCTVELDAPAGQTLTWSDALVVSSPPVARPLRSRVAGSGRPPRRIVLAFVLGSGAGGRIEVMARAVACPSERGRACASLTKQLGFDIESR